MGDEQIKKMEENQIQINAIEMSSTGTKFNDGAYLEIKSIINFKGINKYIKFFIEKIKCEDEYLIYCNLGIKYSDIFYFLNLCMLPDTTWTVKKYKYQDTQDEFSYIWSNRSISFDLMQGNQCICSVGKISINFNVPSNGNFIKIDLSIHTKYDKICLLERYIKTKNTH
jgi:hypothetical protein